MMVLGLMAYDLNESPDAVFIKVSKTLEAYQLIQQQGIVTFKIKMQN
jgi:hypothetical protein